MANIASVALRSGITPSFERGRLEWALVFFESLLRMKSITGSCFLAPPTRCMEVMMKIKGAKHTRNLRGRETIDGRTTTGFTLYSLYCVKKQFSHSFKKSLFLHARPRGVAVIG